MDLENINPFQIITPEGLTAEETVALFVDVFTDFHKIRDPGHVFLIGPRGSGKSMMFRYLAPDCQCLANSCSFNELRFLGIYIPLRNTNFRLVEFERLEHRHASDILNEHILVTHFCVNIFKTLSKQLCFSSDNNSVRELKDFYENSFLSSLRKTPSDGEEYALASDCTAKDIFERLSKNSEYLYGEAFDYARKLAFTKELQPYHGPLCDYIGFLIPLLSDLANLKSFPEGHQIYLLIDDAHWLNKTQARVLNSWVATRTSRKVSLKISTEYNYKTYYTTTGATIDIPHDFSEVDITNIYTGNYRKYRDRIADIVNRRLETFGIANVKAEQFFPEDEEQEDAIRKIGEAYKLKHDEGGGRGFYRSDDALRYARPDFIRSLGGVTKSSSTYSYAGFKQLVHLSSGVVRHFLHPAHLMYAEALAQNSEQTIESIPQKIQNSVVRKEANKYLFTDLKKYSDENEEFAPPNEDIDKLQNLIQGLGGVFRQILLSDRSERRVFSIAFSDTPSKDVRRILKLGIQFGYFHCSTIGRKDSKSGGRTDLFILNRRLAPIWNLDPTGFVGYLFVRNALIEEAMIKPMAMLRRLANDGMPDNEIIQMELFSSGN